MEAERILGGDIAGPYTQSARGQPTAPFYLGAIVIGLFGSSVWTIRLPAAIAGVVTVVALHLIVERRFGRTAALVAAAGFASIAWSVHFSRIAFGLAWWPVIVMAAIAALDRAARSHDPRWWLAGGATAASGVYVYNSHWLFGLVVAAFVVVRARRLWQLGGFDAVRPVLFAPAGAAVVLAPMLVFAADSSNRYFDHFDSISRRNSTEWTDASLLGKAWLVVEWYGQAWYRLLIDPTIDWVDASGVIAPVPLIFTLLAGIGVAEALRHRRSPFVALMIATLLVLPLGPALTIDGFTRRAYAMAPLLVVFAALGAVALHATIRRRIHANVAHATAVALGAIVVLTSVVPYFTTFRDSEAQRWVFVEELAVTVDAVHDAEERAPVFVNWYSARHRWNYETLDYLLDDTPGLTRVPLREVLDNPDLALHPGTDRDQLFVLVGAYARQLANLERLYPAGEVITDITTPRVVAFRVPGP